MKIISFFVYSMDTGGAERVTHDLVNEFSSRGYNVKLICLSKRGAFLQNLLISENNIYKLGEPANIIKFIIIMLRLKKILKQIKADVLVSMGEWPNIISPFVKHDGKTVLVEHNIKTFYTSPKTYKINFIMRFISQFAYNKAEKIFCVSKNIKDVLVSKGLSKDKCFVVYNPFNFKKINALSLEPINYKSENIKIINVGRLTKQKNLPLLLDAFSIVQKIFKNVELWFVGSGEEDENLKKYCASLNISESVIFWGQQENPYKFIANADFFVSSSDYEGFHLTVFESLALKKRVVTTRSISDFDFFITEDCGRLVPIKDVNALAKAIADEIKEGKKLTSVPSTLMQFDIKHVADIYLKHFL